MSVKVSVVMPALNEEANLRSAVQDVLTGLHRARLSGDIIVVNDGSTDGTAQLLKELSKEITNLRVITHSHPKGIGRSFWEGIQRAEGEVVTLLPGDGENDAYEILRYVPLLDSVDLVVPFVFNRGARSNIRQFMSYLYRRIVQISFGLTVNYFNGTVLYRTNVLKQFSLSSNGFFYQAELLIKIIRAGYLYAEVPYGLKTRKKGESKAIRIQSLVQVMQNFLRLFLASHFGARSEAFFVESSVTFKRSKQFRDDGSHVDELHPKFLLPHSLADDGIL